jgi:predicted negative regulator of RcsB-dependent stress response
MIDWLEDNMGKAAVMAIVVLVVLIAWITVKDHEATEARYHELLNLAPTKHDSLEVMLTFEKLKSDEATRSAIIGAGAIAGSAAASSR